MNTHHEITPAEAGRSLLSVLGDLFPDVRSTDLRELCEHQGVTRDGRQCGAGESVLTGERLEIESEAGLPRVPAKALKGFEVLRSEAELLVCLKPAGVSVEGDRFAEESAPLRGAVLHALKAEGREPLPRPRFVHRLDKDTSGVLLVALSHTATADLTAQLAGESEHRVRKTYLALVEGRLLEAEGLVDVPLLVNGGRRKAPVRADGEGKSARTRFERIEVFGRHSWVRLWPETGRTHQLRVHMAHLGHPIVCDAHYGKSEPLLLSKLKRDYRPSRREERPLLARLALHAEAVEFALGPERARVEAALPKDLRVALKQLRRL